MPRSHRKNTRASRSRLRTIILAASVVLLIAASMTGIYKILAGEGNSRAERRLTPTGQPIKPSIRESTESCDGAPNTPDGPDPWGGCWPGPNNTGPRAGIMLTLYTGPVRPDGSCMITTNTVIANRTIRCAMIVNSGNLTLRDSSLRGEVYNYGSGSVLIKDTIINGGSAETETVGGNNITIEDSNLYGNQHEVYCANNCMVENSWLHNNHNFGISGHQDGFLSTGGNHYYVEHDTVYCVGGCTSDIAFIPNHDISNATVDKNLFVATRYASFCLYPSSDYPRKPGIISGMIVTNNVFQRGSNGKCAFYGPVYGWDVPNSIPGTTGYLNVWSGNVWSDGEVLKAP